MNVRLKRLFAGFPKAGIDALLVSSWPNVSYLSGFKNDESWILVSPKKLIFITDSRYTEQAKREAKGFEVVERGTKSVTETVAGFARSMNASKVGFESPIVTHAFSQGLYRHLGAERLKPVSNLVEALRLIKDESEIKLLRRAADIGVKGFHYVRHTVRPGMTEREVQGRLEYYMKSLGAEKPAFDLIIATGARASMPHCQTNDTKVLDNNVLLIDMGARYEGYHSDLTRPIFLGRMSVLQKKVNDIVWNAQRAGIAKAAPGVTCREVDAACRTYIDKRGYGKRFGHGTGHGVGLEIHEAPSVSGRSETVLKPGMVITVEPGIYLPGKFGIRIEDMVLITEKGREVLTHGLDERI